MARCRRRIPGILKSLARQESLSHFVGASPHRAGTSPRKAGTSPRKAGTPPRKAGAPLQKGDASPKVGSVSGVSGSVQNSVYPSDFPLPFANHAAEHRPRHTNIRHSRRSGTVAVPIDRSSWGHRRSVLGPSALRRLRALTQLGCGGYVLTGTALSFRDLSPCPVPVFPYATPTYLHA